MKFLFLLKKNFNRKILEKKFKKNFSQNRKNYFILKNQNINFNRQISRFYSTDNEKNDPYSETTKLWKEFAEFHVKSQNTEEKLVKKDLSLNFTHFDNHTHLPRQVDISEKKKASEEKIRIACASGYIQLNEQTFEALVDNKLKKGNALIVSKIAAIQASKQTANLIPLCHQIALDACDVEFKTDSDNFRVYCEVICKTSSSKTGVEMESLTACSIALLTIYDMCKAVQKDAVINDLKLLFKYGGKSDFKREIN